MDVRYQIFVSSTFTDLRLERARVAKAILDMGHFPAGMEFFPAIGDEQLEYIKSIIDVCDYYVLLIGGRYGSISEDGVSFTEKEYDYAVSKDIPICAFIYKEIKELKVKDSDVDPNLQQKLLAFREKVASGRLVRYWGSEENLESSVIASLVHAIREKPRAGWRRGDQENSVATLKKINTLNEQSEMWRKAYLDSLRKLGNYENIRDSSIDIRFDTENGPQILNLSAEKLIRHFASYLTGGVTQDIINDELRSMVKYYGEWTEFQIEPASVSDVMLYFQVFELIDRDVFLERNVIKIKDSMKYLLKAAFMPLPKVLDDEIPF